MGMLAQLRWREVSSTIGRRSSCSKLALLSFHNEHSLDLFTSYMSSIITHSSNIIECRKPKLYKKRGNLFDRKPQGTATVNNTRNRMYSHWTGVTRLPQVLVHDSQQYAAWFPDSINTSQWYCNVLNTCVQYCTRFHSAVFVGLCASDLLLFHHQSTKNGCGHSIGWQVEIVSLAQEWRRRCLSMLWAWTRVKRSNIAFFWQLHSTQRVYCTKRSARTADCANPVSSGEEELNLSLWPK